MAKKVNWLVWSSIWISALLHLAQPKEDLPLPAVDDCECEAWDRISKNFTSGSEFVHCRRDPSCAGTSCAGKGPDGQIGPFNLTFHVFACRVPKIALRVHLAVPNKGINWTRDFERSERVKVPGLQFIANEIRFSVYFQINITKEEARDDVVLGVSLWGKMSTPKANSSVSVHNTWTEAMDLIEHQHLPLPACRDGKPVPEPCDVNHSSSVDSSTTTTKPSHAPSPVGRPCAFDSMTSGCAETEICSQISKNLSICVCRPPFQRDDDGVCVGGGGGDVTSTPGTTTTTSSTIHPSKSHGGAIGGTIGALIIVALLALLVWWWRRRRNTRLRIVRLYDDEEVLMRNDGYQPVANQQDDNQII